MAFSTAECAWAQTKLKIFGSLVVGIRGFEFNKNVEKEYLHGAGDEPIDIQSGNKTYPLTLTLMKHEVDKINDAALAAGYADITEIPHEAILVTCSFKKRPTDKTRTVVAEAVAFNGLPVGLNQNDKFTTVQLTGMAMKTVFI